MLLVHLLYTPTPPSSSAFEEGTPSHQSSVSNSPSNTARHHGRFHRTNTNGNTNNVNADTPSNGTDPHYNAKIVCAGFAVAAVLFIALRPTHTLHETPMNETPLPALSDLRKMRRSGDFARPLHLVCLHGYLSGPTFMEMQLHALNLSDTDTIVITYLQGPHESADTYNPLVVAKEGETYHYWFRFEEALGEAVGRARQYALQGVLAAVQKEGYVDGVVGFSQGACVVTELMGTVEGWRDCPERAPPAVRDILGRLPHSAVLLAAVCPNAVLASAKTVHEWDGSTPSLPVTCPSFHVIGRSDRHREESEDVHDLYTSSLATRIYHSGGHEITETETVGPALLHWLQTTARTAAGLKPIE